MLFDDLKAQGVYDGQDYLPSVYHAWTVEEETERTPRWSSVHISAKPTNLTPRFNFVAELDGNVVGFFSLLFTR